MNFDYFKKQKGILDDQLAELISKFELDSIECQYQGKAIITGNPICRYHMQKMRGGWTVSCKMYNCRFINL